jgi:hypothetical protein
VVLLVGSYKLRNGETHLQMAPLHHHFEALGWTESKIIRAILDRRTGAGAVRADDAEAEITDWTFAGWRRLWSGWRKSGIAAVEFLAARGGARARDGYQARLTSCRRGARDLGAA